MISTPTRPKATGERTDLVCPDCGAAMRLKDSRYGLFYSCVAFPACRTAHGAHPDGAPLGVPANKATRDARIAAHAAFDQLWQRGLMSRGGAYAWLARAMELPGEAHMGEMGVDECSRVVALCAAKVAELEAAGPKLLDLRNQVRGAFRSWGKRHRHEARQWAAEILGLPEWPGTDALTEDQLGELLVADEDRLSRKTATPAPRPLPSKRTPDSLVRRLDASELAFLKAVAARGNAALRTGDKNRVQRMLDLNLLEKFGSGVRATRLCADVLALSASANTGVTKRPTLLRPKQGA